ncbi:MAG TPA: hypothetical protein VK580_10810 [Steroidobacteraceae bacterium]|nr:hypothetical protein [Steroidobacteraceae bacterium]
MTQKSYVFLSILLSVSSISAGAAATQNNPKSLAETPLDQCTPKAALGWAFVESIQREGESAAQAIKVSEKLEALVNELPPGREKIPVGQQMTPEQSGRFAQLSAQLLIYRYNHLAASRLQRDTRVMGWAADAIEKLQVGAAELKTKDDPGGDGAGLVGLLREAAKTDSIRDIEPNQKGVCSFDLATFIKEADLLAVVQKHLASKEATEWDELRAKYKISGPIDPSKLPSPDREKAIWLQKAVAEPTQRYFQALSDWQNLRRFATVSMLKYSTERDAIITGAGATDYDYDANFNKAYNEADPVTKQTMTAWNVIDQNIPSEAAKENAELVMISKGSEAPKKN